MDSSDSSVDVAQLRFTLGSTFCHRNETDVCLRACSQATTTRRRSRASLPLCLQTRIFTVPSRQPPGSCPTRSSVAWYIVSDLQLTFNVSAISEIVSIDLNLVATSTVHHLHYMQSDDVIADVVTSHSWLTLVLGVPYKIGLLGRTKPALALKV